MCVCSTRLLARGPAARPRCIPRPRRVIEKPRRAESQRAHLCKRGLRAGRFPSAGKAEITECALMQTGFACGPISERRKGRNHGVRTYTLAEASACGPAIRQDIFRHFIEALTSRTVP